MKIVDPNSIPEWDRILNDNEKGGIFLTKEWASVLCETYRYVPKYLVIQNGSHFDAMVPIMEISVPLLKKRGSILPFTDYVEPIVGNNISGSDLFNCLISLGKKEGWGTLEIKNGDFVPKDAKPSEQYIMHTLRLERDEDLLFRKFSRSVRRNINYANRSGVRIDFGNTTDSLRDFYHLISITRKRHGLPPQPYAFFQNIQKIILNKQMGMLALAFYEEKPIAGVMFFHFKDQVYWKYSGSDPRYHRLKANNLILWEMIRFYCRKGYDSMSFGKSEMSNIGLCQYKERYGTEAKGVNYYVYDFGKNGFVKRSSRLHGWHNSVFRQLPLGIVRRIGSVLYRFVG